MPFDIGATYSDTGSTLPEIPSHEGVTNLEYTRAVESLCAGFGERTFEDNKYPPLDLLRELHADLSGTYLAFCYGEHSLPVRNSLSHYNRVLNTARWIGAQREARREGDLFMRELSTEELGDRLIGPEGNVFRRHLSYVFREVGAEQILEGFSFFSIYDLFEFMVACGKAFPDLATIPAQLGSDLELPEGHPSFSKALELAAGRFETVLGSTRGIFRFTSGMSRDQNMYLYHNIFLDIIRVWPEPITIRSAELRNLLSLGLWYGQQGFDFPPKFE